MGRKSGQVGCLCVSKKRDVCRTIIIYITLHLEATEIKMLDCEGEGKKSKK